MSEAWFGRRLARHPPVYQRAHYGPALPSAGQAPSRSGQPGPPRRARPEPASPAGMALITIGAVLLLAVSIPLPFLNMKLLGLILIVAGLVKARALQRASRWLWRNRREVMTALDAPPDEAEIPRVPLDTMLVIPPGAGASRKARRSLARQRRAAGQPARRDPAGAGPPRAGRRRS